MEITWLLYEVQNSFLPCIILITFLSACCKIYCEDNPELTILFGNYKAIDADTVYILRYNKGTQQLTDSLAIINSVSPTDTVNHSGLFRSLSASSDWRVVIPGVNKQFIFTDIKTESGKCPCGGGRYIKISSYQLNNQPETGGVINLP